MIKGNVVKICPKCDQIEVTGNVLVYQSLCDACWEELEKKKFAKAPRKEGGVSEEVRCPKCRVAMSTITSIWCGWVYRCPTCGYERWPKPKKKV